jgi:hypothetical protein
MAYDPSPTLGAFGRAPARLTGGKMPFEIRLVGGRQHAVVIRRQLFDRATTLTHKSCVYR